MLFFLQGREGGTIGERSTETSKITGNILFLILYSGFTFYYYF